VWCEVVPNWIDAQTTVASMTITTLNSTTINVATLNASSDVTFNRSKSGAFLYTSIPTSGTSLPASAFGSIVLHDQGASTIYGMPAISGTSTIYVKFVESATGAGITIYNTGAEPFMGMAGASTLSGTSYLALPPKKPHESATIYGVVSGASKYWLVEASGSWVAGN